jgi:uncharacterized protein YbaA (DUF1428 family)
MTYVEGFIVAVPTANREAYRKQAADAAPMFREFGVTRHVEAWDSDIPEGKVTDFRKAVQAKEDEAVVFSWFEYPSKAAREAANEKIMSDPRMEEMGANMPFDGQRMIMAGFDSFVDEGAEVGSYVDGFVLPVPEKNRDVYRKVASDAAAIFREYGAVRVVEAWGDGVPDGKVTDYKRAVKAEPGENIVFSWIEWPSKEHRDDAWKKVMEDERMKPDHANMPFDGQRMFWGGFSMMFDTGADAR